jgi:hypothetical protein
MPAPPEAWKKAFRDHCDGDEDLDNHFDAAKYCELEFDAGELGTARLLFEHERKPLRWLLQRETDGLRLRLVNEGLDADAVVVHFYPYEYPDQPKPVKELHNSIQVSPPSGLFVASCGDTRTGIITPPALVLKGLAGLGVSPELARSQRTPTSAISLIRLYELWATARIVHHPLSFSFRRRVLQRIELGICDLLYGEAKLFGSGPRRDATMGDPVRLTQQMARVIPETGIRVMINTLAREVLALQTKRRAEYFARKVLPHISCTVAIPSPDPMNGRPWMAEFAFRLASAPETLEAWAAARLAKGLGFLFKYNTIFKAARYIVMAGEATAGPKPLSAGSLHERWDWT